MFIFCVIYSILIKRNWKEMNKNQSKIEIEK